MPPNMNSNNLELGIVSAASYTPWSTVGDAILRTKAGVKMMVQSGLGTSALVIDTSNNVGIGMYSPVEVLDVFGFAKTTRGYKISSYAAPVITSTGSLALPGNADVSGNLRVNNNKFIVDSSGNTTIAGTINVTGAATFSGNVGIGSGVLTIDVSNNRLGVNNVNPSQALDISGNLRVSGHLIVVGTTTTIDTNTQITDQVVVTNAGTGPALIINQTGPQPVMDVQDDGVSVFKIIDGGNVGVGTATPTHKLQVAGNVLINNSLAVGQDVDVSANLFVQGFTQQTGAVYAKSTVDISGNVTVNNNKFTVASASGNVTTAGTLDISSNFRVANNQFTVSPTGVVTAMGTMDVSGNFAINNNKFTVAATSGNLTSTGTLDVSGNVAVNNNKFTVSSAGVVTAAGTLDVSGNVSINNNKFTINATSGNTTAAGNVDISGNLTTTYAFVGDSDLSSNAVFGYRDLVLGTDYALTQDATGKTTVNNKAGAGTIDFAFGGVSQQSMYENGDLVISGNIFTYSDSRLKTNVTLIGDSLNKVSKLRGVTYQMIKDGPDGRSNVGLIAQEVEAVLPEAVFEDNNIKTVAYGNIVGLLIEAIKELKSEVEALKAAQV